jgi:hypothetical protein
MVHDAIKSEMCQKTAAHDRADDRDPVESEDVSDGRWDLRSERLFVAAHWLELLGCEERMKGDVLTDLVA